MAVDYKPHYVIPAEIPDGEYWGKWGGYLLTFEHDGKTVEQSTKKGIRGMNIRTKFRYVNGELDQESLDPHGPSTISPAPQGSSTISIGGPVGNLNCRVALLEGENRVLKQKLLDIEAYFQSGRR